MNPRNTPAGSYVRPDGTKVDTGGLQQFWEGADSSITRTRTGAVFGSERNRAEAS
jgi:hypothetical protein